MMQLADFQMLHKDSEKEGRQAVLDFGNYHLSIVDDGAGSDRGLYEIAVFSAADGVATDMVELPGITAEGDTVKGYLTETDVNVIIMKMHTLTSRIPRQI